MQRANSTPLKNKNEHLSTIEPKHAQEHQRLFNNKGKTFIFILFTASLQDTWADSSRRKAFWACSMYSHKVRSYYVPEHNVPCCFKRPCISTSLVHDVPSEIFDLVTTSLVCYVLCLECPWMFMIFVYYVP